MKPQPIDNYRLTSFEEPTDEMLAQLMREAAEEAKQKKGRSYGTLLWTIKARC